MEKEFHMVLPFCVVWIEDGRGNILIGKHPEGSSEKPYPGLYDLPGGKLEKGEQPQTCAMREVREETCLTIAFLELADVYHNPGDDSSNRLSGLGLCFKARAEPATVYGGEFEWVGWFPIDRLGELEFTPWTRYFLREYLATP